jgi:hypothetical protein
VWTFADLIVAGAAPYFDLPATGLDTYGRSARGYSEGQWTSLVAELNTSAKGNLEWVNQVIVWNQKALNAALRSRH